MSLPALILLIVPVVCLLTETTKGDVAIAQGRFAYAQAHLGGKKVSGTLFVAGEDRDNVVQTVLENLGLWETINWIGLYHWHDGVLAYKKVDEEILEESVWNLERFRKLDANFETSLCTSTLSVLLKAIGAHEKPIAIMIQLMEDGCSSCTTINKNYQPSESVLVRISHPKSCNQDFMGVNVTIRAEFLHEQQKPRDWDKLVEERRRLKGEMLTEGKGINLESPDKPICHAAVPKLKECQEKFRVCKVYEPIIYPKGETKPELKCPDTKYCRGCFGSSRRDETHPKTTKAEEITRKENIETNKDQGLTTSKVPLSLKPNRSPLDLGTPTAERSNTEESRDAELCVCDYEGDDGGTGGIESKPKKKKQKMKGLPVWAILLIVFTIIMGLVVAIGIVLFRMQRMKMMGITQTDRNTEPTPPIDPRPFSKKLKSGKSWKKKKDVGPKYIFDKLTMKDIIKNPTVKELEVKPDRDETKDNKPEKKEMKQRTKDEKSQEPEEKKEETGAGESIVLKPVLDDMPPSNQSEPVVTPSSAFPGFMLADILDKPPPSLILKTAPKAD